MPKRKHGLPQTIFAQLHNDGWLMCSDTKEEAAENADGEETKTDIVGEYRLVGVTRMSTKTIVVEKKL